MQSVKVILTDANGRTVEAVVFQNDNFLDVAARVALEQGLEIDVGELSVQPNTNVFQYFSIKTPHGNALSKNQDEEDTTTMKFPIKKLCRLCANVENAENLQSIFEFVDLVKKCLPIEITQDDDLSKLVCTKCIQQVTEFSQFISSCLRADEQQRQQLNSNNNTSSPSSSHKRVKPESVPIISEDSFSDKQCCQKVLSSKGNDRKLGVFRCSICQKCFRCKLRLTFHLKLHDKPPGRCPVCGKELASELCLYKHYLYNHTRQKKFLCDICGRDFKNKSSLTYHSRMHTSLEAMRPFTCDLCGRRFARKNTLRDHLATRHGSSAFTTVYQCSHCQEVFPTTSAMGSHSEIHHTDVKGKAASDTKEASKLYVCEYCDKCFIESGTLMMHRQSHLPPDPYQCKICNEDLAAYVHLRTHLDDHYADGIKDYKAEFKVTTLFLCQYCECKFRCYQSFCQHVSKHGGPSPYSCRMCSATFASIDEAISHRNDHGDAKGSSMSSNPFDCLMCGKAFTSCSGLEKHMRVHTGERPYYCHVCGKRFTQSSGLNTHLKVHSEERPYICDICNKGFKIVGDYKSHVRRHSILKPFKCDVCGKIFTSRQFLVQHSKIHYKDQGSFVCDICNQSFERLYNLKAHRHCHKQS